MHVLTRVEIGGRERQREEFWLRSGYRDQFYKIIKNASSRVFVDGRGRSSLGFKDEVLGLNNLVLWPIRTTPPSKTTNTIITPSVGLAFMGSSL